MKLINKTYIVTGGAGFIGSNVVDTLIKQGNKVIIIDDLSSGSEDNIFDNKNCIYINEQVQKVFTYKFKSIDGIFHLAAQASVPYSMENFFESSENNILSTLKVISWAKDHKIPIVYASSSAVYGNLHIGDDQTQKYDIVSPYAQDKLTLEHYMKMMYKIYKIRSVGLRLFNVYGPRQNPKSKYSGVISIFIDRLLNNNPVTVNGGYQTRDYIYIKNVVDVMLKSMEHITHKESCDVYNLGTGVSITVDKLLIILSSLLNKSPNIILKDLPSGDPEHSAGVFNKIEDKLKINVKQFIGLKDGLKLTVDYYKKKN